MLFYILQHRLEIITYEQNSNNSVRVTVTALTSHGQFFDEVANVHT